MFGFFDRREKLKDAIYSVLNYREWKYVQDIVDEVYDKVDFKPSGLSFHSCLNSLVNEGSVEWTKRFEKKNEYLFRRTRKGRLSRNKQKTFGILKPVTT